MPITIISNPLGSQMDRDIPLGGAGSGHWEHKGWPGERGGSSPGDRYQIGVTSSAPGKTAGVVAGEMPTFAKIIKETTATEISVDLGRGGWEGGHEVTFITQYQGNGQTMKALAQYGKDEGQQAVLVQKYTTAADPEAQPQNRFVIQKNLDTQAIEKLEDLVSEAGFGGWTWFNKDGKTTLVLTCIPQWGGKTLAHLSSVHTLAGLFQDAGLAFTQETKHVVVSLLTGENYDDYL